MSFPRRLHATVRLVLAAFATCWYAAASTASSYDALRHSFENPPEDCRILMRWWWFGAAVTEAELDLEMESMRRAGIGGFEVQPVYPMSLDDPAKDIRNLPYLSPEFLSRLYFVSERARKMGLRMDLTLGSGWPYGGPNTPVWEAAGRLRIVRVALRPDTRVIATPAMEPGEQAIAAFVIGPSADARQIAWPHQGSLPVPEGAKQDDTVVFFVSSRTGQQVKRPAIGAEGFVLDHYDRAAVEHHLASVGDRLLRALGPHPPWAVFSDSLEVYGSEWTVRLPEEFRRRRGYDLIPHLPDLLSSSAQTAAVRHDWARTLTEMAEENYLIPVERWAKAHGTRFRSQTYGAPPVVLSSNSIVDLPEGEDGPHWRAFSVARWAASASHLYGRPVTSAETWTWLHTLPFAATPLDLKAEADRHFLQGINQLVGHGWPYSPPAAGEPGWSLYAAAALNAHNPWWIVMPDVTRYMQRVSFLLRQGKPANDIALYLPTDDAWAAFKRGQDSVNSVMESMPVARAIPEILAAGYNLDFIDDGALAHAALPYRAIVLPSIERIPLASFRTLAEFARRGGILIATGRTPSLAPGVMDAADTGAIVELSRALFRMPSQARYFVQSETGAGARLNDLTVPDCRFSSHTADLGFIHRAAGAEDIYFIANTSNVAIGTEAVFRIHGKRVERWDPFSGDTSAVVARDSGPEQTEIHLDLAPYESAVIVFTSGAGREPSSPSRSVLPAPMDLSTGWTVTFGPLNRTVSMDTLHSWTDDAETRFYSGEAVYARNFELNSRAPGPGTSLYLDFGEGTPVFEKVPQTEGMRALLEGPVREAAMVYINGSLAGYVWHPPYEVNVTGLLRRGVNTARIVVGNLAINRMARQSPPDYRLLMSRYGVRFPPPSLSDLQPLRSGLLGRIQLIARWPEQ